MKNNRKCLFLPIVAAMMAVGCASVPSDAPAEVKNAATELERSKDLSTADHYPNTIDQSKKRLSESITAFKNSKEKGAASESLRAKSVALANDSRSRSLGANQLTQNMKAWDSDIMSLSGNYSLGDLISQNNQLTYDLNKSKSDPVKVGATNEMENRRPFAKLTTFRMSSSPVYFELGSAVIEDQYAAGIEEVAQIAKLDDGLVLHVTGFSDFSGSDAINEKLSAQRAENVAAQLEKHGIDRSRISAEGMGGRFATEAWQPASMQLDRKAVITVSVDQNR
jgi:outer membrane protein OmpA-like peptidoglycan-associated protein